MVNQDPGLADNRLKAFGTRLRSLRKERGLTQAQLGELINYTGAFISYVELAERRPPFMFALRADAALESGDTLESLWWDLDQTSMLKGFFRYISFESKAVEIRRFEQGVIPGLLQVPAYTRALAHGAAQRGSITLDQAEERAAVVMSRQRILQRRSPPVCHFILDESCIRRPVGGPEAMKAQLTHLEQQAALPNTTVQIAPFAIGEHRSFVWPATLLTLPDQSVLLYSESRLGSAMSRDAHEAAAWERDWRHLRDHSLSHEDSMTMIRTAQALL
ncbi:Scr1 family TA system antitoxin-like transcriptional regulator [Kitasatospora misakiensis]|uniref:Scr1 family TA system antitoxin-like transcriptional regulator n=1 Tax=Kitasatospora misakiensis TaxID=67330 RepID=A0ABW0WX26_9ACTN